MARRGGGRIAPPLVPEPYLVGICVPVNRCTGGQVSSQVYWPMMVNLTTLTRTLLFAGHKGGTSYSTMDPDFMPSILIF